MAAPPFAFAVGSVSFHPESVGGPVDGAAVRGAGGAVGGGDEVEHPTTELSVTVHAAAISRHARTRADRYRETTPSMVAQLPGGPVSAAAHGPFRALSSVSTEEEASDVGTGRVLVVATSRCPLTEHDQVTISDDVLARVLIARGPGTPAP